MSVYSEKPWLKNYKVGSFKLKTSMKYPEKPLFSILDEAAISYSGRDAIYFLEKRIKYRDLIELVDSFANALHNMGLEKGERVVVFLPTCPQYIISDFAVLKNGAVIVPASPYLRAPELMHQIKESGAVGLIFLDSYSRIIREIEDEINLKWYITTSINDFSSTPEADKEKAFPGLSFLDLINKSPPVSPEVEIDPVEDLAILAFTGGSTGTPKGVMVTHFQRLSNIHQGLPWMMAPLPTLKGTGSILLPLPVFHSFGHWILQSAIFWGLRLILLPDPRNIRLIVKTLNEFRPFMAFMVPSQLIELSRRERGLKRMQTFIMTGAAPLPLSVAEEVEEIIKMPVSEGFGMSETGPCTHINLTAFSKITRLSSHTMPGIGIPVPDTEARIVDPETGMEVSTGEVGELQVKGPQVMKGYWPEAGSGLEEGGWLKTGDLAKMDQNGYFFIVDRIKDMINIGGMKVYSRELDEIIIRHEAVENVVTVGIPDPRVSGSEKIKVFIKPKEKFKDRITEQEIIRYCRERVSSYAVPHSIEFRDQLPHTVTEKLFKRALREEFEGK